ncbi:shikimate kinase, partial [Sphingomonas bacterium]|uniref:shikimate kinase n=1 Tax=Sphingomonas bacterium TaxID=1895847 RepID=UPI00266F30B8
AVVVWLAAHPDVLAERVRRRDTRPLLHGRDARVVLAELARVRAPFYAQAHHRIGSQKGPHETTVAAILKALGL